jgi:hypothetical protein
LPEDPDLCFVLEATGADPAGGVCQRSWPGSAMDRGGSNPLGRIRKPARSGCCLYTPIGAALFGLAPSYTAVLSSSPAVAFRAKQQRRDALLELDVPPGTAIAGRPQHQGRSSPVLHCHAYRLIESDLLQ